MSEVLSPLETEFEKEKAKRTEQDVRELKATIKGLERDLARAERRQEEADETIGRLEAEVERLKDKIVKLVNTYV